MKKIIAVIGIAILVFSTGSMARDDIGKYQVQPLLETDKAKKALFDIPLYFGTQEHPASKEKYGEVMTNKKTNATWKSDQEACEWAMLSALKALQARAKKEGMNAVVNIQSYYKKREFISETEFECGAGTIMAGVTLKGTLVKI